MRTKEDILLKLANNYEKEFQDSELSENDLNDIFISLVKDYNKLHRKCSSEGIDAGELETKEYKKAFKISTSDEKEELIDRVKNRISCLISACDDVPEDIEEKYCEDFDYVFEEDD
jgi:hypothetical protein